MAQPEFFTIEDFEQIKKFDQVRKDDKNPEHNKTYEYLKNTYQKTEYWAEEIQKSLFPNGTIMVLKKPTNQAARFESYHWAKIYPTKEAADFKFLAITIGIDADDVFVIKIDTVSLNDSDDRRKYYLKVRGDRNNSPFVKHIPREQIIKKDWNYLLSLTENVIKDLFPKYKEIFQSLKSTDFIKIKSKRTGSKQEQKNSKNQILFGPPGTGKTYNTITKSLSLIEGKTEEELKQQDRKYLKMRFEQAVLDEKIVFVTFHQSLSYEDFIEGIKPDVDKKTNSITYKVKPGIFKEHCRRAMKNLYLANVPQTEEIDFDHLFSLFIEHLQKNYKSTDYPFTTKEGSRLRYSKDEINQDRIVVYYEWSNNSTQQQPGRTPFTIKRSILKDMYFGGITSNEKNLRASLTPYIGHHLSPHYAVFKSLYDFIENFGGDKHKKIVEQIEEEISIETYIEKIYHLKKNKSLTNKGDNYVIIIDEINRGNVSQVFGELISLLEEDKRLGEDESLTAILPYSQKEFAVPNNLFIIGTMNTADRSVEALDTALRRRFTFEEISADPNLLTPQKMIEYVYNKHLNADWDDEFYRRDADNLYILLGIDKSIENELKDEDDNANMNKISNLDIQRFNGINLQRMLITINSRLNKLLSKDHIIGHAFFINVTSIEKLYDAFFSKLIPQLQEYFYGDFGKIGLVLGEQFVTLDDSNEIALAKFQYEDSDLLNDRRTYKIKTFRESGINIYNTFFQAVKSIYSK